MRGDPPIGFAAAERNLGEPKRCGQIERERADDAQKAMQAFLRPRIVSPCKGGLSDADGRRDEDTRNTFFDAPAQRFGRAADQVDEDIGIEQETGFSHA